MPQVQDMPGLQSQFKVSLDSLLRSSHKIKHQEEMEDTRKAWPIESTKQGSHVLTEIKTAGLGPAWACMGLHQVSACMLWLFGQCFCRTHNSNSGSGCILTVCLLLDFLV